nr:hypothetical protein [uncultured bacterium]
MLCSHTLLVLVKESFLVFLCYSTVNTPSPVLNYPLPILLLLRIHLVSNQALHAQPTYISQYPPLLSEYLAEHPFLGQHHIHWWLLSQCHLIPSFYVC